MGPVFLVTGKLSVDPASDWFINSPWRLGFHDGAQWRLGYRMTVGDSGVLTVLIMGTRDTYRYDSPQLFAKNRRGAWIFRLRLDPVAQWKLGES